MCEQVSTLGYGTYGRVYSYRIKETGEFFAVKIAKEKTISATELREISCVKALKHPNVIDFLAVGFNEKTQIYAVMDMGITLSSAIRLPGASTPLLLKSYSYQILVGVDFCHARNVMHRDLKPQNIILFRNGMIKIADFGLARALSCVEGTDQTLQVVSLPYRPPELLLGGTYGEGLDKWSVGCILYEMFTQKILFHGSDEFHQLRLIFGVLGKPNIFTDLPLWEDFASFTFRKKPNPFSAVKTPEIKKMIEELLVYDPEKRANLRTLYSNKFFDEIRQRSSENYKWYGCIKNLEERVFPRGKSPSVAIKEEIWKNVGYMDQSPANYFYAIDLLSNVQAKEESAVGCLWIASMMKDMYALELENLAEDNFGIQKIHKRTEEILEEIGFDTLRASCYDFYKEFKRFYPALVVDSYGVKFMYYFSLHDDYNTFHPKDVALAAISIECDHKKLKFIHASALEENTKKEMVKRLQKIPSNDITLYLKSTREVKDV